MDEVRNMLKECEKFLLSFVGNQHLPNLTYSWTVMERHEVAQQVRTLLCRIAGFPDPDPGLRPLTCASRSEQSKKRQKEKREGWKVRVKEDPKFRRKRGKVRENSPRWTSPCSLLYPKMFTVVRLCILYSIA